MPSAHAVLGAVASLAVGISAALCQQPAPGAQASALRVPDEEVREHWLGPREQIRTAQANTIQAWPGIALEVVVGPDGAVITATATEGPKEFFDQAVRIAKTWRYQPFLGPDGKPIVALVRDGVSILPPELRPSSHKPFPRIKDWKSLTITLERTQCYGTCPAYRIEIHGNGDVIYNGKAYVAVTGQHKGEITQENLLQLYDAFRSADYLSLNESYRWSVTDNPTYTTSIAFDGIGKSVVDYVGEHAGMPMAVSELEEKIDRLAGTDKWTRGNAETATSLTEEGWNFKAHDAVHEGILPGVAERGSAEAVRNLIAAGAPVEGAGKMALMQAARRGDTEMVRALLEAGAGANDKDQKGVALCLGALSGNLGLVELLLSYGADPGYVRADGMTVLMNAAQSGRAEIVAELLKLHPDVTARDREGKTVLMHLDKIYGAQDEKPGAKRVEVARMLIAAGADVNAQDNEGNSPLMEVPFDADVARMLIEKGADVNARNKKGWTPLMNASSPEVARLLLASGADPSATDEKGNSVLENARQYGPPEIVKLIQAALAGKVGTAAKQ